MMLFVLADRYQYEKFSYSFPASFNSTQNLQWYIPELIDWKVNKKDATFQSFEMSYTLEHALQEFHGGYDQMTVKVSRSNRTKPFTIEEIGRTLTLSRGEIRYSTPVVSKDGDYATSLFTVAGLDGFFTLRAPVNFPAQCNPRDTQAIVSSILVSISNTEQSLGSELMHGLKVWWTMRMLEWPETTSTCF